MNKGVCLTICLLIVLLPGLPYAQLPACTGAGGYIYLKDRSSIWNWDPATPMSAANPVLNTISNVPGVGLAVSENLNEANPPITFYSVSGGEYVYYNGSGWINTGHAASSVNIGAGGGYIFNLTADGQVYRYDGTARDRLVATAAGFNRGGPYDLAVDCAGNFYVLREHSPAWLRKYSPDGVLLRQWDVFGAVTGNTGAGLAIVDNVVYYYNSSSLQYGVIGATSVTFSIVPGAASFFPAGTDDFASCPIGGLSPVSTADTAYLCDNDTGITITARGSAPYSFSILSGNAQVTGTGADFHIKPITQTHMVIYSASSNPCYSDPLADTFLIVPAPALYAGPDVSIHGCGHYTDTLDARISNAASWIIYDMSWAPMGDIISGGNTLHPVVAPTADISYVLTVTTGPGSGGCTWQDTVTVHIADESVSAAFTATPVYGCEEDTVYFSNHSQGATSYSWDFDDGTASSLANPDHIYTSQGSYSVTLIARNDFCADTAMEQVSLQHPLSALFTVPADSVCINTTITFTNTSVAAGLPGTEPRYYWDFGNGDTSSLRDPDYTYTTPGIYRVMLIAENSIPCRDTVYRYIYAGDSRPVILTPADTAVCAGSSVLFYTDADGASTAKTEWVLPGADTLRDRNPVLVHFETPGLYTIHFTARYPACPDEDADAVIRVDPVPVINIGKDTSVCPGGSPVVISDLVNGEHTEARWMWSTEDTGPGITVSEPGVYWATVYIGICSNTDSIELVRGCYMDVPNVFSPNGDGINDYFFPRGSLSGSLKTFRMLVFNRWGQKVFASNETGGRGWDGRLNGREQPDGVYVYQIEVTFTNGWQERYQGNVTLLR